MPAPLSLDIRLRLVSRVESGNSRREAAEQFEISPSAAIKWMQRWEKTGSVAALPSRGSQSPLDQYKSQVLAILQEKPDMTLEEMTVIVSKRIVKTSKSSIHRFCERHSVSFKKNTSRSRTGASGCGEGSAALERRAGSA